MEDKIQDVIRFIESRYNVKVVAWQVENAMRQIFPNGCGETPEDWRNVWVAHVAALTMRMKK